MSTPFSRTLARMVVSSRYDGLPAPALEALRISVADTAGCALGAARQHEAPDVGRIVEALGERGDVPVIGTNLTVSASAATFANVVLARYLDYNDTFIGARNPTHPSDTIMGLWSLGTQVHASGRRFAEAIASAYATMSWLGDHVELVHGGWDLVTPLAIGAAAGGCRLLGLDEEQTAQALGIAAVDNVTVFATRVGQISHWKGLARSAVRKGLFAAQLAGAGVTGPVAGFDGRMGLFEQLDCRPDTLEVEPDLWQRAPLQANLKSSPVQYFAQCVVEAGTKIRARVGDASRIAGIRAHVNAILFKGTAGDRSRWRPGTRETADHSLPFCIGVPILTGALREEHFTREMLEDPRLHALMDKVEVFQDPELDAAYPERLDFIARVTLTDGTTFEERVPYPLGVRRPMSAAQVKGKFAELAGAQADSMWQAAWNAVEDPDVGPALAALAAVRRG